MNLKCPGLKIGNHTVLIFGLLACLSGNCNKPEENVPQISSLTDIEGNIYKTVKIGTQWWMAENLSTTRYNDGSDILELSSNNDFGYYKIPAYCWYYDKITGSSYGAIYNWYAVNTGMLCPTGWSVPSSADWTDLIDYLGGEEVAGNKMKETGNTHWAILNEEANNKSGFTARPGAARAYPDPGYYRGLGFNNNNGDVAIWWAATESDGNAWIYYVRADTGKVGSYLAPQNAGFNIRCIKDKADSKAPAIPVLTTASVTSILPTTALSGGNVSDDGGAPVSSRGLCWSTSEDPKIELSPNVVSGNGKGSFSVQLAGLVPNTTYFVRAYAINSAGTGYGNQVSFTTAPVQTGTITDIDGNIYKTVNIGTKVWMAENLKTTKYSDGTEIPLVTNSSKWSALTDPGYCWYENDSYANRELYGALYNWYCIGKTSNGGRNICPVGWHVPTDAEWTILTDYLGGEYVAGGKLKEAGSTWTLPNNGATNETGFTARPGGYCDSKGTFGGKGTSAAWWSSSDWRNWPGEPITLALARTIMFNLTIIYREKFGVSMKTGYSVRCLKD